MILATCDHASVALTVSADLRPTYRRQCQVCGATLEVIRKGDLSRPEIRSAVPYNPDLVRGWWDAKSARAEAARMEKDREFWASYSAYLRSPEWADRRRRVLERDGRTCRACLKRKATEVHHLSYAHVGNEPLFDLVAVCEPCHRALHPHMREA